MGGGHHHAGERQTQIVAVPHQQRYQRLQRAQPRAATAFPQPSSRSAMFNTLFDVAELHLTGRPASVRPRRWRVVHELAHEASSVLVTWPVIVAMTGLGWAAALAADLGLTPAYAVWAYLYHLGFDAWRPLAGGHPAQRRRRPAPALGG